MDPVAVTAKLLKSNITVDSILLGNVENNMLHGISNATGKTIYMYKIMHNSLPLKVKKKIPCLN